MTAQCPVCLAEQSAGLLCSNCCDRLEHDLGDVAAIVAELDVTLSKQARIGAGGKGGLARERMPLNVGAMQVADDLQNTLTTWARDVVTNPRWATAKPRYDQPSVDSAHALLSYIGAIRKHPAVEELVDEITEAVRRARQVVDRPADRQYLGQCLAEFEGVTCTEEIWARPGAVEVTCKVCGVTHEVTERREWMMNKSRDMLFSIKEAAQIIGSYGEKQITESAIRNYVSTGQIVYHGKAGGNSLIRLGDLMDVIAKNAAEPRGRRLKRSA